MPSFFSEDTFEKAVIELLENMGYGHIYAPDMDRDYSSPLLDSVLRDSLVRINKGLAIDAIEEFRQLGSEEHGVHGLSSEWYHRQVLC